MTEIIVNVRPIVLITCFIIISLILLIGPSFILPELLIFIQYLYTLLILFIPGFLILTIIENKERDFTTTILFSLGLSIFFATSVIMLSNIILPIFFNITPISKKNLLISYIIAFLLLICPILIKNRTLSIIKIKIKYNINTILMGSFLILVTLIGTLTLKIDNTLILLSFSLLSVLPVLIYFRIIEANPFLIWAISLSLVMYNSIFGHYPRATDNISEIFTIKEFVLKHGTWKQIAPNNILAMPNVALFVPFLSFFTGGLFNTYKLVIPFIASFIPVVIYKITEISYGKQFAFYSAYFFCSLFIYFTWCSITAKMVFAGLFLGLIGIIILKNWNDFKEKLLLIIFSASLVFSHYGTAAIFVISLILSYLLSYLLLLYKSNELKYFTFLYISIFFSYTMYVTKGSIFDSVTLTIANTLAGIKDIFSPRNYGSELLLAELPVYLEILRYLYIIAFITGLIEILYILFKRRNFVNKYFIISCTIFALIPIPYIFPVGQYGGGRAWFIPCILASPFIIAGLVKLSKFLKLKSLIIIFIIIFFMFNSGLVAEIFWKHNVGASIYISYPRIIKSGDIWEKEYVDRVTLNSYNLVSAFWLANHIPNNVNVTIYADWNAIKSLHLAGISRGDIKNKMGDKPYIHVIPKDKNIKTNKINYLYLRKFNIENKVIKIGGRVKPELISITKLINPNIVLKVYTNNNVGSEIYYIP